MKAKEMRWMDMDDLRALCISHEWFTMGTNDEYERLLSMTKVHSITTARLLKMAKTIMRYSDPETYNILGLDGILYCLGKICHTCFSIED